MSEASKRETPLMCHVFRILAVFVLCAGVGLWLSHGAQNGFWKTSVEKRVEVPIVPGMPELGVQETIEWEDRLVTGIETPLLSLILALCLWGLSLMFFSSPKTNRESLEPKSCLRIFKFSLSPSS